MKNGETCSGERYFVEKVNGKFFKKNQKVRELFGFSFLNE